MSHIEKELSVFLLSYLGNNLLHSGLAARGVHWLTNGCIRGWEAGEDTPSLQDSLPSYYRHAKVELVLTVNWFLVKVATYPFLGVDNGTNICAPACKHTRA